MKITIALFVLMFLINQLGVNITLGIATGACYMWLFDHVKKA